MLDFLLITSFIREPKPLTCTSRRVAWTIFPLEGGMFWCCKLSFLHRLSNLNTHKANSMHRVFWLTRHYKWKGARQITKLFLLKISLIGVFMERHHPFLSSYLDNICMQKYSIMSSALQYFMKIEAHGSIYFWSFNL